MFLLEVEQTIESTASGSPSCSDRLNRLPKMVKHSRNRRTTESD